MNVTGITAEVVVHSPIAGTAADSRLFKCERWSIPSVRPVMISIVPTSLSGTPFADAVRLAGSLSRVLSKIAVPAQPKPCSGPGPDGCRTHKQLAAGCVLVLVGDGSPLSDYSNAVGIWAKRINRDPRYKVVPACPTYAQVSFLAELRPHFPGVKILEWTRNPA